MVGHEEKANRYIALLDAARAKSSWSEVPELIRKIKKHAPQRSTLIQTATAEHSIATSGVQTSSEDVDHTVELSSLLETPGDQNEEEIFQAKTCLLWAQWIKDSEHAPSTASINGTQVLQPPSSETDTSIWTKVCAAKSAYIQGMEQERAGNMTGARLIWSDAARTVESSKELVLSTPQFMYWSEQILGQLAVSSTGDRNSQTAPQASISRLQIFHAWATLAADTEADLDVTYRNTSAHLPRLTVWRKYYEQLSKLLKHDSAQAVPTQYESRLQQSAEFLKVEKAYENELLLVNKFPRANESNEIVEHWVEQVIDNWRVLCGPTWRNTDLAEGGRNAVGRNVLDILYRAATKSFHSTLILRRLFQVHKSLAEFDLAYRALDTYIELVERARDRNAKSDHPEPGQESDEIYFSTIAEGIEGLCQFGGLLQARKAYDLCLKLESSLEGLEDSRSTHLGVNGETSGQHKLLASLSNNVLEYVYRAIGVGKAHWARWTPYSDKRAQLQEEALSHLNKACEQRGVSGAHSTKAETLYATALLLAETREINEAIALVKSALETLAESSNEHKSWTNERRSTSLWHLLALLLSSRHEFDDASKSCVAAFEQYPPATLLVGPTHGSPSVLSEKAAATAEAGLVHDMECDELQRMVEVRITELALRELSDGPEEAVNCSNELLTLISQLFAHLDLSVEPPKSAVASTKAPRSSIGTFKTTKSVFGRRKHNATSEKLPEVASLVTNTTRPGTSTTQAPTIHITDDSGVQSSGRRHLFGHTGDHSHSKRSSLDIHQKKLVRKSSHRDTKQAAGLKTGSSPGAVALADTIIPAGYAQSSQAKQELKAVPHNLDAQDNVPPPASHDDQPPQQDIRLPTLHPFTSSTAPIPRFAKIDAQKHALTVLAKVWLIIATLYRRANMFDDSQEACDEASKVATKIESLTASVEKSARSFSRSGWGGGGKSIDEIWADVYCERAELQLAIYGLRQSEDQLLSNEGIRETVSHYEQCLMLAPDHIGGVIGLSNLLLDYYEKKIDIGKRVDDGRPKGSLQKQVSAVTAHIGRPSVDETERVNGVGENGHLAAPMNGGYSVDSPTTTTAVATTTGSTDGAPAAGQDDDSKKTPEHLNRIAARDRAYGLLSKLTKLGSGWDNSEAWYALARAHELGGEIDKSKDVLWWCIELEDTRPIRHWRNLGYALA